MIGLPVQLTAAHLAAHILYLAEQNNILVSDGKSRGRASHVRDTDQAIILIPEVRTFTTYALALHEIGHHLGHPRFGTLPRLQEELLAWEWARANAAVWTDEMTRKQHACLQSYLRWADRHNAKLRAKMLTLPVGFKQAAGVAQ